MCQRMVAKKDTLEAYNIIVTELRLQDLVGYHFHSVPVSRICY